METNPSNIRKRLYFPYGHPFLLPHGTMLMGFDTNVHTENTDVRWVGFHPPKSEMFLQKNFANVNDTRDNCVLEDEYIIGQLC